MIICAICGTPFQATRPDARFCGATCRKRASRHPELVSDEAPRYVEDPPSPAPEIPCSAPGPVHSSATLPEAPPKEPELAAAVRKELEKLEQTDTWEGQMALSAARKLASASVGPGTTASLMKEFKTLMAEIRQNAERNQAKGPDQQTEMERIRQRRSYKAESA